jgi:hypothetical protein
MNNKVAKFIRKIVYGDLSLREVRKYKWGDGKKGNNWGNIEAVGKRAEYQQAKKLYYQKKRS